MRFHNFNKKKQQETNKETNKQHDLCVQLVPEQVETKGWNPLLKLVVHNKKSC